MRRTFCIYFSIIVDIKIRVNDQICKLLNTLKYEIVLIFVNSLMAFQRKVG